jgi:hypothetical protein
MTFDIIHDAIDDKNGDDVDNGYSDDDDDDNDDQI